MLTVRCPCGEVYHADDAHAGRALRCVMCGQVLAIKDAASARADTTTRTGTELWPQPQVLRRNRWTGRRLGGVGAAAGLGLLLVLVLRGAFRAPPSPSTSSQVSPAALGSPGSEASQAPEQAYVPTSIPPGPIPAPEVVAPAAAAPAEEPPAPAPRPPNRLATGDTPYAGGIRSGRSEITAENGTETDAMVRVIRQSTVDDRNVRSFYVRSHDQYVATDIPPGQYVLRVAFGEDWDTAARGFRSYKSYSETETFAVTETTSKEVREDGEVLSTSASRVSITLHKVSHGNFSSHPIDEDEFWK